MANVVTQRDILNMLDEGCIHTALRGGLCSQCLKDVRTYIRSLLYRHELFLD